MDNRYNLLLGFVWFGFNKDKKRYLYSITIVSHSEK